MPLDVIVVRLKTHGQRLELPVHRSKMERYVTKGRDSAPSGDEIKSILVVPTIFANAYKRQRATRQSVLTAFEKDLTERGQPLTDDNLFDFARSTVLQFGELVEDDTARNKRKDDEAEAAGKLRTMISERVLSYFTGEPLPDDEFDALLAKHKPELPYQIFRPPEGSHLLDWACFAAYSLVQLNKGSLVRRTVKGQVVLRADAKPKAVLLQKFCRESPALVMLTGKTSFVKPTEESKKDQDTPGEDEYQDEGSPIPDIPVNIYTLLFDPSFLEEAQVKYRDANVQEVAAVASTPAGAYKFKPSEVPVLEILNCAQSADVAGEDVRLFSDNIVLEPTSAEAGPTKAELDIQNRLKAFEDLKAGGGGGAEGSGGRSSTKKSSLGMDEDGDPYGDGGVSRGKKGGGKKKGRAGNRDDDEGEDGDSNARGSSSNEESYSKLTLKQLQDLCMKYGLSKGGKKMDLLDRVLAHEEAIGGGGKKGRR